jgi:tyrosinase
MVDRYTSAPLELPTSEQPFERADLIFYGVDHSQSSFEARLFLNDPDAGHDADHTRASYAGRFFVLGHGGCFGDTGHCDVPPRTDAFDLRPPHQLTPAIRIVTVTDALRDLIADGATTATVTVISHTAGDDPNGVLAFDTVRLATYTAGPA